MIEKKFSKQDIVILEAFRNAPLHFGWNWMFQGGATLKVEIVGRWSVEDAEKVRHLLSLMGDIIEMNADEPPPEPTVEETA